MNEFENAQPYSAKVTQLYYPKERRMGNYAILCNLEKGWPMKTFVCDDDDKILEFKTEAEAKAKASELQREWRKEKVLFTPKQTATPTGEDVGE